MMPEKGDTDEDTNKDTDGKQSALPVLYARSLHASGIASGMVIPAAAGFGIDKFFGTIAIFTILGTILGVVFGFWQLITIAIKENSK
ncbi:MAG: AtpZ/AtpI family protein [Planctomycetaceae bacterium]|jgi:F0F1-type ATP synthase assembly protein I|nr:AtpZ/AtpI family protein [Planctomycetaceae bacterium]